MILSTTLTTPSPISPSTLTRDVLYVGLSRNFVGSVGIILGISAKTTGTVVLDAR